MHWPVRLWAFQILSLLREPVSLEKLIPVILQLQSSTLRAKISYYLTRSLSSSKCPVYGRKSWLCLQDARKIRYTQLSRHQPNNKTMQKRSLSHLRSPTRYDQNKLREMLNPLRPSENQTPDATLVPTDRRSTVLRMRMSTLWKQPIKPRNRVARKVQKGYSAPRQSCCQKAPRLK